MVAQKKSFLMADRRVSNVSHASLNAIKVLSYFEVLRHNGLSYFRISSTDAKTRAILNSAVNSTTGRNCLLDFF